MRMLNRKEASAYLSEKHGVSRTANTLAKLASIGGGPKFRRLGRHPFYNAVDLDEWVAERLTKVVASTSELPKYSATNPFGCKN